MHTGTENGDPLRDPDSVQPHVQGVLLAGGKSRRMGRDKALLPAGEEHFITRIARVMAEVTGPPILATSDAGRYAFLGLDSAPDRMPDAGPLAGLHAAMHHTRAPRLLLAPCDLPFLSAGALHCLLAHAEDAAVVHAADARGTQPLVGVYHRSLLPVLEEYLHSETRSVQRFLDTCDVRPLRLDHLLPDYDPYTLCNINTPADLRAVKDRM